MKLALLLCLIAMLTGCATQTQDDKKGKQDGTDQPIIISDGSTHLRHKGVNADFQIAYNGSTDPVIVNDPGFAVGKGDCVGVTTCPTDFMKQLVKGWSVNVFDATSVKIMTVSSLDNVVVNTIFYGHYIDPEPDKSGDTPGTDLTQHDFVFNSASFTNGGGATAVTITCASSPCKLKIHYHN